jgi:hypothetical protein
MLAKENTKITENISINKPKFGSVKLSSKNYS